MEKPAKRALHGLSEAVGLAVDASEYSPELSAREDQTLVDTEKALTTYWNGGAR